MSNTNNPQKLANAIRALSIDAVQQANSGHPGAPMGMADIAQVLWCKFLKHNPKNPNWFNRDRFVLSNGHGSMLIYSLLHLTGYDLSLDDIKNFRQLNSKTPGHPEYGDTPGVDTTTGPLGQGIANAIGMAIAERTLAEQFNNEEFDLINHFTYVFMGDGCLMEGISHEACSLAGTLKLNKLIAFWDDNGISIDGKVESWFTDNTPQRFKAYGWHVVENIDGHDAVQIEQAINEAQKSDLPTLICCKTQIGYGSPNKANTEAVHGAPLGDEEITLTKKQLNWEYGAFKIPQNIYHDWNAEEKGHKLEQQWQELFKSYTNKYPENSKELERRIKGDLKADFAEKSQSYIELCQKEASTLATRKASQNTIQEFAKYIPEFLGGSADLTHSNLTSWDNATAIASTNTGGNYISYGVREFAMSHIMNGLALHGGFIPFGGTFLVFSDYARNAIRMSALMHQRVIYVFTHDSIGLGEDGPTHQPVEHTASLRLMPNMTTWRPSDAVETAVAWQSAVMNDSGPTSLILSRQGLPCMARNQSQLDSIAKGGYVLVENESAELTIIATGSEVSLGEKAIKVLGEDNIVARLVSMPSPEVFEQQDQAYKQQVLRQSNPSLAIEAGIADYWYKYVSRDGAIIGMQSFGASAPAGDLMKKFGFTVENVCKVAQELV